MLAASPPLSQDDVDRLCRKLRRAFNFAPHDADHEMMLKFLESLNAE
jgi:hypothetical protein